jgi:hypothetical protein
MENNDLLLFQTNFKVFLENSTLLQTIAEYFHCRLKHVFSSYMYVSGSGLLSLGYLSIGWENRVLIIECPQCTEDLFLYSFGGSILSGYNFANGICLKCGPIKTTINYEIFRKQLDFIRAIRAKHPFEVSFWEDYIGQEFCWKTGLKPALKRRLLTYETTTPVDIKGLIEELNTQSLRKTPVFESKETSDPSLNLTIKNHSISVNPNDINK